MGRRIAAVLLLGALVAAGCEGPPPPKSEPDERPSLGPPIEFAWGTTEGGELSSEGTRGRATAILFVTTYDLASQLVAQTLDSVLHRHVPRANGGAVVLETPKYVELADAFRTTLHLSYPVAMADSATLTGGGPFGQIEVVPLLVVLDRSGHEVWRKSGVAEAREIEAALALASRRGFAAKP